MIVNSNKFRKLCRVVHRDLSFFFTGVLLIYAISGIVMNHRDKINPNYSIERIEFTDMDLKTEKENITENMVLVITEKYIPGKSVTKYYFPSDKRLKVFVKGGSVIEVDINTGHGVAEVISPRVIIGAMTKLHYNPGSWWTWFSDIFSISLIIIVLTGVFMMKGKYGIIGRGGIELIIGILIPIIFLLFF